MYTIALLLALFLATPALAIEQCTNTDGKITCSEVKATHPSTVAPYVVRRVEKYQSKGGVLAYEDPRVTEQDGQVVAIGTVKNVSDQVIRFVYVNGVGRFPSGDIAAEAGVYVSPTTLPPDAIGSYTLRFPRGVQVHTVSLQATWRR